MKSSAWIAVLLGALVALGACGSTQWTDNPASASGGVHVTAGVSGTVSGENVSLEQALITSRHRVLGLALFDGHTDPDMADLAPGTWYLGIRFAYEEAGPSLSADLVNYGNAASGSTACARLVHVDSSGVRQEIPVTEGSLEITDWTEQGGLITAMIGSVDVRTPGGGRISGTFKAPVQGWYLAP